MESYETQLEKLKNGEIKTLEVKHENYFLFREAWLKRSDRKFFVGEAHHNGNIIYHYDEDVI